MEANSRQERNFNRKENYWARCTKCFLSTTVSRLSQAQGLFSTLCTVCFDSKDQNTKLFKHLERQFRNSQSTLPISTIWQAVPVPTERMLQTMLEGVSFLPVGTVGFVFTFRLALKLPMVVVDQKGKWMWCQVDLRGLRRFDCQVFPTPRFKRPQTFAVFIEWQDFWYINCCLRALSAGAYSILQLFLRDANLVGAKVPLCSFAGPAMHLPPGSIPIWNGC